MSGGTFDHQQCQINFITESISGYIDKFYRIKNCSNNNKCEICECCTGEKDITEYLSNDLISHFTDAVVFLTIASIYANRIDWFLAGDDGEKAFDERLANELKNYCGLSFDKIKKFTQTIKI